MTISFTITGIYNYIDFHELRAKQEIILRKEPSNNYDEEAIAVYNERMIKIGYVANSVKTKAIGTYSAGRLYDKIPDEMKANISFIIDGTAIGSVDVEA